MTASPSSPLVMTKEEKHHCLLICSVELYSLVGLYLKLNLIFLYDMASTVERVLLDFILLESVVKYSELLTKGCIWGPALVWRSQTADVFCF